VAFSPLNRRASAASREGLSAIGSICCGFVEGISISCTDLRQIEPMEFEPHRSRASPYLLRLQQLDIIDYALLMYSGRRRR